MTDQICTSTSVTLVAAVAKPTLNSNGRIVWPGGPAKKQYFSLPDNIIYYMVKNPSTPEFYLKLAKSCKYIFEKKPFLVVDRIDGGKFCSSKDWDECYENKRKCCVNVDLAKLISKIWLTNQYCYYDIPKFNALLPQKFYKCENAQFISYWRIIVFDSFKVVASCFENFYLDCVKMVGLDGNDVMIEEILGSLPNVKEFIYKFKLHTPAATTSTMKNICKLGNLDNLRLLQLHSVPELGEVKDFEAFIMKHKETKIQLRFHDDVSQEYKAQFNGLRF